MKLPGPEIPSSGDFPARPETLSAPMLILWLLIASGLSAQSSPATKDPFPLSKGTYWIYKGIVKAGGSGTEVVTENKVTWKMEILELFNRGNVTVAVVKGHPADFWWYENGRKPGDYLIVRVGEEKYYLLSDARVQEALKKARDPGDELGNLVKEDELFLELPLRVGKTFGETFQITRRGGMYCWLVESESEANLKSVRGLAPQTSSHSYQLWFRTNPDHTVADFVPGVGFVSYAGGHHGTVSEFDVKLVEFHQGVR